MFAVLGLGLGQGIYILIEFPWTFEMNLVDPWVFSSAWLYSFPRVPALAVVAALDDRHGVHAVYLISLV